MVPNFRTEKCNNYDYRIVTLVSLNDTISLSHEIHNMFPAHSHDLILNSNGKLIFNKKEKQFLLIHDSEEMNELEFLFSVRSSDFVVFLINETENIHEVKIRLAKKHMPTHIFCPFNIKNHQIRNLAKTYFGDSKIVKPEMLSEYLCNAKYFNSKIIDRPYCVPHTYKYDQNYLVCEGFIRKGFVTPHFVVNGTIGFELESVQIEDGRLFTKSDIEKANKITFEVSKSIEAINEDMSSISSDQSDSDNYSDNIPDESTSQKILEYEKSHKERPEAYDNLVFYKNEVYVRNQVAKESGLVPSMQSVTIKLKRIDEKTHFLSKFLVLYNSIRSEMIPTIFNMSFSTKSNLNTDQLILIDMGHILMSVKPKLYTANIKEDGHVCIESSNSSMFCFIAPRIYINSKCDIYNISEQLLNIDSWRGECFFERFCDTPIISENVIAGIPRKIDKRYCTVHKMFGSKNEVMYFRNFKIWIKGGNEGIIKKPIGVRGVFKAYFNVPVKHGQKISMSLFSREYL